MADNKDGEGNTSHKNEHPQMADNKEREDALPRGNDWEVVSLTASTYAAAHGPRGDESIHEENSTVSKDYEAETSRALFMSGHFVFPPSQHENLPIEPESFENSKGISEDEPARDMNVAEKGKAEQKEDKIWGIEGVNVSEEFPGIPLLEQKGDQMMIDGSGFDESATLHSLAVDHKEKDVYGTATFSSFHSGPDISGTEAFGESIVVSDLPQPYDDSIDPSPFISKLPRSEKDDEIDDSDLPCGAWWKRRMVSLCSQVKDTSTFWSVFVAAAVMGLVIFGQHCQQERWQVLLQRWHLSVGDEVLLLVAL